MICSWSDRTQFDMPNIATNQAWWHHRSMPQQDSQQGPWVLKEQAIMKAKRRSQTGSKMTGHNSTCMWIIGLPKLKILGFMYIYGKYTHSKAIQSLWLAQRQNAWEHLSETDLLQGSARTTAESAHQSRYVALHVVAACEEKAGLPYEGYLWRYDYI